MADFTERFMENRGHGEKLSRKQEAAISALISNSTLRAASRASGISERTISRWLSLPTFKRAYSAARRALVEGAVVSVQRATGRAVQSLLKILSDAKAPAAARVAASRTILEHAMRERPVALDLPEVRSAGDIASAFWALLAAVASGDLTPDEARSVAGILEGHSRAVAVEEFSRRLAELEKRQTENAGGGFVVEVVGPDEPRGSDKSPDINPEERPKAA